MKIADLINATDARDQLDACTAPALRQLLADVGKGKGTSRTKKGDLVLALLAHLDELGNCRAAAEASAKSAATLADADAVLAEADAVMGTDTTLGPRYPVSTVVQAAVEGISDEPHTDLLRCDLQALRDYCNENLDGSWANATPRKCADAIMGQLVQPQVRAYTLHLATVVVRDCLEAGGGFKDAARKLCTGDTALTEDEWCDVLYALQENDPAGHQERIDMSSGQLAHYLARMVGAQILDAEATAAGHVLATQPDPVADPVAAAMVDDAVQGATINLNEVHASVAVGQLLQRAADDDARPADLAAWLALNAEMQTLQAMYAWCNDGATFNSKDPREVAQYLAASALQACRDGKLPEAPAPAGVPDAVAAAMANDAGDAAAEKQQRATKGKGKRKAAQPRKRADGWPTSWQRPDGVVVQLPAHPYSIDLEELRELHLQVVGRPCTGKKHGQMVVRMKAVMAGEQPHGPRTSKAGTKVKLDADVLQALADRAAEASITVPELVGSILRGALGMDPK